MLSPLFQFLVITLAISISTSEVVNNGTKPVVFLTSPATVEVSTNNTLENGSSESGITENVISDSPPTTTNRVVSTQTTVPVSLPKVHVAKKRGNIKTVAAASEIKKSVYPKPSNSPKGSPTKLSQQFLRQTSFVPDISKARDSFIHKSGQFETQPPKTAANQTQALPSSNDPILLNTAGSTLPQSGPLSALILVPHPVPVPHPHPLQHHPHHDDHHHYNRHEDHHHHHEEEDEDDRGHPAEHGHEPHDHHHHHREEDEHYHEKPKSKPLKPSVVYRDPEDSYDHDDKIRTLDRDNVGKARSHPYGPHHPSLDSKQHEYDYHHDKGRFKSEYHSKMPECAHNNKYNYNLTFCLDDSEYPREAVIWAIKEAGYEVKKLLNDVTYQSADNLVTGLTRAEEEGYTYKHYYGATHAQNVHLDKYRPPYNGYTYSTDYFKKGGYVCPSDIYYTRPKRAMNTYGKWKVIVNVEHVPQFGWHSDPHKHHHHHDEDEHHHHHHKPEPHHPHHHHYEEKHRPHHDEDHHRHQEPHGHHHRHYEGPPPPPHHHHHDEGSPPPYRHHHDDHDDDRHHERPPPHHDEKHVIYHHHHHAPPPQHGKHHHHDKHISDHGVYSQHSIKKRGVKERKKSYTQTVRVEQCIYQNAPCSFIDSRYHSSCIQKHNFVRLVAWTHEEGLHVDTFKLPVACSCHVRQPIHFYHESGKHAHHDGSPHHPHHDGHH